MAMPYLRVLGADLQVATCVLRREADRIESSAVSAGGFSTITAAAASRTEKTRAVLARAAAAAEHAAQLELLQRQQLNAKTDTATANVGHAKMADKSRRRAAKAAGAISRVSGAGGGYATTGGYPYEFLCTLELRLKLQQYDPRAGGQAATLDRAAELAARTTQFNTAMPRSREQMRAILEAVAGCGEIWTMAAVDRFGDHGIVGVIVLAVEGGGAERRRRRVLLLSISCRVLALEPATVFLSQVLRASSSVEATVAGMAFTERNAPCQNTFRDAGFTLCGRSGVDSGELSLASAIAPSSKQQKPQHALFAAGANSVESVEAAAAVLQSGQEQQWVLDENSRLPQIDTNIYGVTIN